MAHFEVKEASGPAMHFPHHLLQGLERASDAEFLQILTKGALDPISSYFLLAHCEDHFAHICANLRQHGSFAATVAALGRIVPFATFLTPCAVRILEEEQATFKLGSDQVEDVLYLLGIFRLLRSNARTFRKHVNAAALSARLEHSNRPITNLIIRILQLCLKAADCWYESMLTKYLDQDPTKPNMNGQWDEKTIDYRFLALWEEDRHEIVARLRESVIQDPSNTPEALRRIIKLQNIDDRTCAIGGVSFPLQNPFRRDVAQSQEALVETCTTASNTRRFACALKSQKSLLIMGPTGAGKTLQIHHAAQRLGKLDSMITLHLNEQSDAKLLVGVYTTGTTAGTFTWKPGVLTTAVQEGRWVLIEDLDRAPAEVIGTLLPLIERGTLSIPNRKAVIHAAHGFRILATIRTTLNHKGEEIRPLTHMLGIRHWLQVHLSVPDHAEHGTIAQALFPTMTPFLPQFMSVYERVVQATRNARTDQKRGMVSRETSPRDLLKWLHRVSTLLNNRDLYSSEDIDSAFLEAMDCFAGFLPDGAARQALAETIAEELQIDPQRRDFLLERREVPYQIAKSGLSIGRYKLVASHTSKRPGSPFSTSPHTTRMLERVAAAVVNHEPLLLVGETGVGKTTAVQHLASSLGKKLVAFNLSQQSEAGDLLGGFKPVNARSLMIPLKEEFDDLFEESFGASKNQQFLQLLGRQTAKSNWRAVCKLWREALKMVEKQKSKNEQQPASPPREGETPSKKRKVENKRSIDFTRWKSFTDKITTAERSMAGSSDAFLFSFVEGNIVKAVRNGDWILLDEINLASSDTLESISDLLDSRSPSILLTEAGNIERIEAHPDFRVFAAMNPATDVGKKDLPPGIRSRFTELYVGSPDKDLKSLQSIVAAYLRQEIASDPAIVTDISLLYQNIIALAEENRLVDGAGQRPHFSLRTLTRTLSFAKRIHHLCGLRRAIYEGFQMSFMTFLDAESSSIVQPVIQKSIFPKRTTIAADLRKPLRKPADEHGYVQAFPGSKHWIRLGGKEPEEQRHYIFTPFVEKNLENLVRASSTRQFPVLIQGPTSSGKTSMIEYLAKRTGHEFVRINNHEHTDLQEYLGTYVSDSHGRLQFQEGVLVKALRDGHWIVLDELNLAPTDVLEALNRLLDDNRELLLPETQEIVRPHPEFMLFATQNPAGLYGGRKQLSRAFRNRFLELHFDDIPINELQEILHKRTKLPESRCKKIVDVYIELATLRQENRLFEHKSFATLRDLFRWALRDNDTIEQLAHNGYMLLGERVRKPEERASLKSIIERVMSKKGPKVIIDEETLYSEGCGEIAHFQASPGALPVVWTRAMRRLYVLVVRAIKNNEPVLLVGETGCGKTTVCQLLASAVQQRLHIVNAHQNTETADLIGSQRPVRNRASTEMMLRQLLQDASSGVADVEATVSTDALLQNYDQLLTKSDEVSRAARLADAQHLEIQLLRTRYRALFEWVDGSLVQAMKEGSFFLLDEISLADDSVLERINSVLESQRTVLLAEKGSLDASIAASDGFQFFATMNPGGDYGKRELSPALRNRFTEIWVPALSNYEDILDIVHAKIASQAKGFSSAIVNFAIWFRSRYDTSATSSVSIRDTLAWIEFINVSVDANPAVAFVHGAAMVYVDTLGANPAGFMSIVMSDLEQERQICIQKLGEYSGVDTTTIYNQRISVSSDHTHFSVGPFSISRHLLTEGADPGFTFEPQTTKGNALRVLRALQLTKPIMLEGSPGVGKTALVTAVAAAARMPLTRINLSDQTDLLDLFGADAPVDGAETGKFVWRDAPFLHAMKKGEWVLLDEMNLASQAVLEGLNACLDHRGEVFIPELGQSFSRHPDFRLFAAQNPHHQGGGRKGLPASFVNRFTVVFADIFSAADLTLICQRNFPSIEVQYIEQVVKFVSSLTAEVSERKRFGSSGGPWEFNLRDVSRWLSLASSPRGLSCAASPLDIVEMLFASRFRSALDRADVRKLYTDVFPDALNQFALFCNSSSSTIQVGLGLLKRDELTTQDETFAAQALSSDQLQTLQWTMICVQQCWPVILVGPTGSGKTLLVEQLAAATGTPLVTLSMNAETDAIDLIGGYEQVDPTRHATTSLIELCEILSRSCKDIAVKGESAQIVEHLLALQSAECYQDDNQRLRELMQRLPAQAQPIAKRVLELYSNTAETEKAMFEWVDGPLIDAMQQGQWVVLDNANLCSPSVLDRLNSLLEPNGVLSINEHSNADGTPRVIKPHANFRVFLTVDPRFGELSRAMRNRAVELHLSPASSSVLLTCKPLAGESAMTRFRVVGRHASESDFTIDAHGGVLRDHLAFGDRSAMNNFAQQIDRSLFAGDSCRPAATTSLFSEDSLDGDEGVLSQIHLFHEENARILNLPLDFVNAQVSCASILIDQSVADGEHSLDHPPSQQRVLRSATRPCNIASICSLRKT
jgi:midasin